MTFDAGTNSWQGAETYLVLWGSGGHPGSAADAVRRWVAPSAGSIQITGNAVDGDSGGGGGVTVSIRKGSSTLWQQALANGNTTGVIFNVTSTVSAGDAIDFVINRGADGNNAHDSTGFDPTIVYTSLGGSQPQSATLTWNANTESDLAGYRLYQSTTSGTYGSPIEVGNVTSYAVNNLVSGTRYYFRLTAVDTSGNESSPSSEVSIQK